MAKTVREIIRSLIKSHLKNKKGFVFGQCLTAVGWVGGTLPELYEEDGMIELSMADVANGGIVVGSALANKRPIYVIRYQGFNWYNSPMIVNYACKSKELWNTPCPVFVRGIAMEGGIGPVAGSSHHSLYYRMPGIKISSPMTPKEYLSVYNNFMKDDDVYYVSEHRKSYDNSLELKDVLNQSKYDFIIFAISVSRFESYEALEVLNKQGYKIGLINILWIKPFNIKQKYINALKNSKFGGIVIDDDYEAGVAKSIANDINLKTNKPIYTMGLKNKSAGFHFNTDNLPPTAEEIFKNIINIIKKNKKIKK